MSELEEKLGTILSNQDAMSQIMALAQSLGGKSTVPPPAAVQPAEPSIQPEPLDSSGDLFSSLGELDPRFLTLAMRLIAEYRSNDDHRAALLNALRPFVKPERYAKLDKAIQISKLVRVIRIALDSLKTGRDDHGTV